MDKPKCCIYSEDKIPFDKQLVKQEHHILVIYNEKCPYFVWDFCSPLFVVKTTAAFLNLQGMHLVTTSKKISSLTDPKSNFGGKQKLRQRRLKANILPSVWG